MPTSPSPASWLRAGQLGALLLTGAAYWGLAYATPRPQFGQLLGLLAVAGVAYVWLLRTQLPLRWGLGAALLFRLLWLPATPALSDDFYRFRWDGLLVSHGHNPFAETPRQLLAWPPADSATLPMPELRRLLPHLNSPAYFSVYPPVCQALYGAATKAFPTSQTGFLIVVRLALLLADAGAAVLLLWLLPLAGWPARRALAYLLHPLVVVEVVGNVHMEGAVVCLLLLAGALLARRRLRLAAGAFALAVATKLLPLLALPLLARCLSPRRLWQFVGVLTGCLGVLFAPFLSWRLFLHIGLSIGLYFQRFEFNASVFYVLLALGKWLTGYDLVGGLGPLLGAATICLIFLIARRAGRPALSALPHWLLLTFSGYFMLATTVHPWYLVPLVALSCFSRLHYARVWAGLAVLSYSAYRTSAYTESGVLLTLEYGVVLAWAIGEYYLGRWQRPSATTGPWPGGASEPGPGPSPRRAG
ncbi:DUF2029 domain-containing protein [Hymenobacter ginsengisoli]|uniref:DUF2029 domain-containing protein n=1 Tax=Hymenobacter ginsengisoli TaxID=1051626 RepID=A0ABP8QIF8_9BACT|nr:MULTISPECIES: hypothetical protein [unclassified Hymenobacter]MBO2029876.1 hypothetical protein [Hymenobacter sp. BT559]